MNCRVLLAQIEPTLGNLSANLELHLAEIEIARKRGIEIVLFPELSLSGYFLRDQVAEGRFGTPKQRLLLPAVLARVQGGETLTITSDGTPVAELRPLPRRSLSAAELVARRRRLAAALAWRGSGRGVRDV